MKYSRGIETICTEGLGGFIGGIGTIWGFIGGIGTTRGCAVRKIKLSIK